MSNMPLARVDRWQQLAINVDQQLGTVALQPASKLFAIEADWAIQTRCI